MGRQARAAGRSPMDRIDAIKVPGRGPGWMPPTSGSAKHDLLPAAAQRRAPRRAAGPGASRPPRSAAPAPPRSAGCTSRTWTCAWTTRRRVHGKAAPSAPSPTPDPRCTPPTGPVSELTGLALSRRATAPVHRDCRQSVKRESPGSGAIEVIETQELWGIFYPKLCIHGAAGATPYCSRPTINGEQDAQQGAVTRIRQMSITVPTGGSGESIHGDERDERYEDHPGATGPPRLGSARAVAHVSGELLRCAESASRWRWRSAARSRRPR